jgi:hypothetical protein
MFDRQADNRRRWWAFCGWRTVGKVSAELLDPHAPSDPKFLLGRIISPMSSLKILDNISPSSEDRYFNSWVSGRTGAGLHSLPVDDLHVFV